MTQNELTYIFRNPPVLESKRIYLRKIEKNDCLAMFDYSRREDVTKYLLWSPHPSVEYTRAYIASVQRLYKAGKYYDWAIVLKSNNKMVGTVGFTKLDAPNMSGEIGYVLNPDYHKLGYATEAARIALKFGFEVLGLNRIEARYMVENHASRRVMERIGMRYEGTMRGLLRVNGRYRDISVCSIMRNEYFVNNLNIGG